MKKIFYFILPVLFIVGIGNVRAKTITSSDMITEIETRQDILVPAERGDHFTIGYSPSMEDFSEFEEWRMNVDFENNIISITPNANSHAYTNDEQRKKYVTLDNNVINFLFNYIAKQYGYDSSRGGQIGDLLIDLNLGMEKSSSEQKNLIYNKNGILIEGEQWINNTDTTDILKVKKIVINMTKLDEKLTDLQKQTKEWNKIQSNYVSLVNAIKGNDEIEFYNDDSVLNFVLKNKQYGNDYEFNYKFEDNKIIYETNRNMDDFIEHMLEDDSIYYNIYTSLFDSIMLVNLLDVYQVDASKIADFDNYSKYGITYKEGNSYNSEIYKSDGTKATFSGKYIEDFSIDLVKFKEATKDYQSGLTDKYTTLLKSIYTIVNSEENINIKESITNKLKPEETAKANEVKVNEDISETKTVKNPKTGINISYTIGIIFVLLSCGSLFLIRKKKLFSK